MNTLLSAGCWLLGVLSASATTGRARLALRLAVLLILAPVAFADITTSALTGRVTISGTPGVRVTVTATSPALQHPRTTLTGPRGTYWLGALPPGPYEVTFSLAGHTSLTRTSVVELARVARVDATLEPSEDEESVTSTANTIAVSETTSITTHFDDAFLDRLPAGRDASSVLTPDPDFGGWREIDDVPLDTLLAEDLVEQTTILRGGTAADYELFSGTMVATRTRQGTEDFFLSLRGTPWEDRRISNSLEATAGGRVLPQRLWFFASAWGNGFLRGANAKLHAQLGSSQHVDASFNAMRFDQAWGRFDHDAAALRHTAVAGPHFSAETEIATRSYENHVLPSVPRTYKSRFLASRASYVVPARSGDHVLTAAFRQWDYEGAETRTFSLGDRWSSARWVVNAGVQQDGSGSRAELMPRLAVTFDPFGNGRRALAASHGRHSFGTVSALGYATAIGGSGAMRVDLLRRYKAGSLSHSLQLDARYRLFDRFETGATASLTDGAFSRGGNANFWAGASLPVGQHEFGATLFQRAFNGYDSDEGRTEAQTDLALRYSIPFSRVRVTLAGDAVDLFRQGYTRRNRFWVRLQFK